MDFNCDRWKNEWEKVRVSNMTQREIWEQMTARLAETEHECDTKLGALRKVSRDWIDKVKADMSRTEEEHAKRVAVLQRVSQQWEADATQKIEQLSMELAEAKSAQNVAEAAATTLEMRCKKLESGAGLESMRGEMSALEQKLEEVATENVHMEIAHENFKQQATAQLQESSERHVRELSAKEEAFKALEKEKEELELRCTAYNGLCSELQLKNDYLTEQLATTKAAVETMNARFNDEVAAAVKEELALAAEQ